MKFCKLCPDAFYGRKNVFPFYICVMKLMGGILTEYANLMGMLESETIDDIVKDFVAY